MFRHPVGPSDIGLVGIEETGQEPGLLPTELTEIVIAPDFPEVIVRDWKCPMTIGIRLCIQSVLV